MADDIDEINRRIEELIQQRKRLSGTQDLNSGIDTSSHSSTSGTRKTSSGKRSNLSLAKRFSYPSRSQPDQESGRTTRDSLTYTLGSPVCVSPLCVDDNNPLDVYREPSRQ